jgi:hypothetical protein
MVRVPSNKNKKSNKRHEHALSNDGIGSAAGFVTKKFLKRGLGVAR